MKVFLDTNVMLDFLGERKLFFKPAEIIVNLADIGELTISVSALSFATCNYFLGKEFGLAIAKEKISKFKIISEIIALDEIIINKSLISNFNDFEDATQYYSALQHKCEIIITRNKKDFKNSEITVMTPTEFLVSLQKN